MDVVAGDQRSRTCDLEHVGLASQLCTHADQTINRVFRRKKMSAQIGQDDNPMLYYFTARIIYAICNRETHGRFFPKIIIIKTFYSTLSAAVQVE